MRGFLYTVALSLAAAFNIGYATADGIALTTSLETNERPVPLYETVVQEFRNDNEFYMALGYNIYALTAILALFLAITDGKLKPFSKLFLILMLSVAIGQGYAEQNSLGDAPTVVPEGTLATTQDHIELMQVGFARLALGIGTLIALDKGLTGDKTRETIAASQGYRPTEGFPPMVSQTTAETPTMESPTEDHVRMDTMPVAPVTDAVVTGEEVPLPVPPDTKETNSGVTLEKPPLALTADDEQLPTDVK